VSKDAATNVESLKFMLVFPQAVYYKCSNRNDLTLNLLLK
jgi:hypothetical protein